MLISMRCYFSFLEQLLIQRRKSQAIMIATPFSVALDLMAPLFAVNLAFRGNRWTWAALEFALLVVLLRIFYSIPSIGPECVMLYSTLLGFEPAARGVIQRDDESFQPVRIKEKKVSGVVIDCPVDCGISSGWLSGVPRTVVKV